MFIEQIIEFELKGPVPPNCTCTPTTDYFQTGYLFATGNLFS